MIDLKHPHRQSIRKKGGNAGTWVRECKCGIRREHRSGWFDGDLGAFTRAWKAAERHLRKKTFQAYEFV